MRQRLLCSACSVISDTLSIIFTSPYVCFSFSAHMYVRRKPHNQNVFLKFVTLFLFDIISAWAGAVNYIGVLDKVRRRTICEVYLGPGREGCKPLSETACPSYFLHFFCYYQHCFDPPPASDSSFKHPSPLPLLLTPYENAPIPNITSIMF